MKTATLNRDSIENVSSNERGFRAIAGLAMVSVVVAGTVASPVAIFALSMIATYMATTAIIGSDPVYAALNAVSTSGNTGHMGITA